MATTKQIDLRYGVQTKQETIPAQAHPSSRDYLRNKTRLHHTY
jgi:hypothetical protein